MARVKSKQERTRQPEQQELFQPRGKQRGGKRRGAGRRPRGARAGERHQARPEFKPTHALHVVVRVAPAVGSLRRRKLYKAMRDATITAALREWLRIVHIRQRARPWRSRMYQGWGRRTTSSLHPAEQAGQDSGMISSGIRSMTMTRPTRMATRMK